MYIARPRNPYIGKWIHRIATSSYSMGTSSRSFLVYYIHICREQKHINCIFTRNSYSYNLLAIWLYLAVLLLCMRGYICIYVCVLYICIQLAAMLMYVCFACVLRKNLLLYCSQRKIWKIRAEVILPEGDSFNFFLMGERRRAASCYLKTFFQSIPSFKHILHWNSQLIWSCHNL